jgi:hypothetical protein
VDVVRVGQVAGVSTSVTPTPRLAALVVAVWPGTVPIAELVPRSPVRLEMYVVPVPNAVLRAVTPAGAVHDVVVADDLSAQYQTTQLPGVDTVVAGARWLVVVAASVARVADHAPAAAVPE